MRCDKSKLLDWTTGWRWRRRREREINGDCAEVKVKCYCCCRITWLVKGRSWLAKSNLSPSATYRSIWNLQPATRKQTWSPSTRLARHAIDFPWSLWKSRIKRFRLSNWPDDKRKVRIEDPVFVVVIVAATLTLFFWSRPNRIKSLPVCTLFSRNTLQGFICSGSGWSEYDLAIWLALLAFNTT